MGWKFSTISEEGREWSQNLSFWKISLVNRNLSLFFCLCVRLPVLYCENFLKKIPPLSQEIYKNSKHSVCRVEKAPQTSKFICESREFFDFSPWSWFPLHYAGMSEFWRSFLWSEKKIVWYVYHVVIYERVCVHTIQETSTNQI